MGVLRGTIYSKMSVQDGQIPDGCVLRILMFDASDRKPNSQTQAKLIGKTEIMNPKSFPIDYKIEFNNQNNDQSRLFYYLTVFIEKNNSILYNNNSKWGKLSTMNKLFIGNEYGDIIARNSKVRRHLDVFLNFVPDNLSVQNQDHTIQMEA